MRPNKLVIDGDILVYRAASAVQKGIQWEADLWTYSADLNDARSRFHELLRQLVDAIKPVRFIIALSSSTNFRKAIDPSYKANRSDKPKPLVLTALRNWLIENREDVWVQPSLEADDIMGLLADEGWEFTSMDKDMGTVPGVFHRFHYAAADGSLIVTRNEQTAEGASRHHLLQTLSGDATDGIQGVPGIGPKTAPKVLGDLTGRAAWDAVVKAFVKAGQTEADAIRTARLTKILTGTEYAWATKTIRLWNPPPV
jgi:DNA polymerase I